jgi:hypothetical protein
MDKSTKGRSQKIDDPVETCNTCDNEGDNCPVMKYITVHRGVPGSIPLMAAAVLLSSEVGVGKFPCHSKMHRDNKMGERQECPDEGLEFLRTPSIHCPIKGQILVSECQKSGMWRETCMFYKGEKTITDLAGEDYMVVMCEAEGIKRKRYKERSEK